MIGLDAEPFKVPAQDASGERSRLMLSLLFTEIGAVVVVALVGLPNWALPAIEPAGSVRMFALVVAGVRATRNRHSQREGVRALTTR